MNYWVVFVWGEKLGWPRTLFIILLWDWLYSVLTLKSLNNNAGKSACFCVVRQVRFGSNLQELQRLYVKCMFLGMSCKY